MDDKRILQEHQKMLKLLERTGAVLDKGTPIDPNSGLAMAIKNTPRHIRGHLITEGKEDNYDRD